VNFPLTNMNLATRKFALIIATLTVLLAIAACGTDYPPPVFIESPDCENLNHGVLPVTDLTLSTDGIDIEVQVEVANNSSKRTQGLMCRESIPPDTGMLFTYTSDHTTGFWMFNTYVALDILFIDQHGDVVDKILMAPCPREPETLDDDDWKISCATVANEYVPKKPWRYALEFPADWLSEQNISDSIVKTMNVSWPEFEAPGIATVVAAE
jgi:uncharacterized membrane protein (UPF0127 family)